MGALKNTIFQKETIKKNMYGTYGKTIKVTERNKHENQRKSKEMLDKSKKTQQNQRKSKEV